MARTSDGRLEALGREVDRLKAEYEAAKSRTSAAKNEKDRAYADVAWCKSEIADLKRCIDEEYRAASVCHQAHNSYDAKNHSLNAQNMKPRLNSLYDSKDRAWAAFESYRDAFSAALEEQRRIKTQLDSAREAFQTRLSELKEQNARENAKWHEKSCRVCGATIRYHDDWTRIPDLCPQCKERERAQWREKPCKACGTMIRYSTDWTHPPNYCKKCKAEFETKRKM